MKILIVTQYFWPENFKINDLCDGLVENGHSVTVLTGLPNYPEGSFYKNYGIFGPYKEKRNNIEIIRVPIFPRGEKNKICLVLNYLSFFLSASIVMLFLVKNKYDKIFAYQLSPVFSVIPAIIYKKIRNVPVVMWVCDLWPDTLEATGVMKNRYSLGAVQRFVDYLYSQVDLIYISSRGFKRRIMESKIHESKIKYWPQWAENIFCEEIVEDENATFPEGFKVMFAGNIGSAQDFETVVNAATLLKDYQNIHFIILGDGSKKEWAQKEIIKHGIEKNFHFYGKKPISLMPYYYSKADAMLLTLLDTKVYSMTLPSKVQTYMTSGKPIIGAINGEGAELIQKWNAGIVCPASNAKELAQTILSMSMMDKNELASMGENSKKCYETEFRREALLTTLINDFNRLGK